MPFKSNTGEISVGEIIHNLNLSQAMIIMFKIIVKNKTKYLLTNSKSYSTHKTQELQ